MVRARRSRNQAKLPAVLLIAFSVLFASAPVASAHEPELNPEWFTKPIIASSIPPQRVDRTVTPTEGFIELAAYLGEDASVRTIASPLTPDGDHLWILRDDKAPGPEADCASRYPALETISLVDSGNRVVNPGKHYQPIGIADLHRGPVDQVLVTNGCGSPIAIARVTPAGDLVDPRTIAFENPGALRTLRWVNLRNEGPRLDEYPGTPGVIVELDAVIRTDGRINKDRDFVKYPDGAATAVTIETGTGTVRSNVASANAVAVWELGEFNRRYVHQHAHRGSWHLVVQSADFSAFEPNTHRMIASWSSPVRGVATAGETHAVFSDDGLVLVTFTAWEQREERGDLVTETVTQQPVRDADWTPTGDALAWAGPDGSWLRFDDGTLRQLSDAPATSIDISDDGTTIVAVEQDGYRTFTWQPDTTPEASNTISPFTVLTADGLGPLGLGDRLDELPLADHLSLTYAVADPTHSYACGEFTVTDQYDRPVARGFFEELEEGPIIRSIIVGTNPNMWGITAGDPTSSIIERFGPVTEVVYRKAYYNLLHKVVLDDAPNANTMLFFESDAQTVRQVRIGTDYWGATEYCFGP